MCLPESGTGRPQRCWGLLFPQSSSSSSGTQTEYIGEEAAKAAALAHANVSESQTKYIKCYYDYDHGQPVCYCVEFAVGDTRYEYEIDLHSGAVLEYEIDPHHS